MNLKYFELVFSFTLKKQLFILGLYAKHLLVHSFLDCVSVLSTG